MKPYRCTICGEVFIGSKVPSDCPFCGVRERHIKALGEVFGGELFAASNLSSESTKNLMQALNLETTNASFYKCASKSSESESMRALFKRLAKIEREHADIIRKHLELDPVDFLEEECSSEDYKNLEKAFTATKETIRFYRSAGNGSPEPKISALFRALMEVEEGVLKLLKSFGVSAGKKEELVPPTLYRTKLR